MKLGIFQISGGGMAPSERLRALEDQLRGQALDLILCPELFMSGYHAPGLHHRLAEPQDGTFANAIGEIARRHGTAICYGYPEAADGLVYNAAALIGPDGLLLANHRKRVAAPHSFEVGTFANGKAATVVSHAGIKIAIVICYEVEFPEFTRQAARLGAELILAPVALVEKWGSVAEKLAPTRAFENGVWLAYANHAGQECPHRYFGGSRIVTPFGEELAVAGAEQELIVGSIRRSVVAKAQARLPFLADLDGIDEVYKGRPFGIGL